MFNLPKLMITGHGRHGKDTLCDMLRPWQFISSSMFVAEAAVYPALKELYGYDTLQQCYDDRINHRAEWYDAITAYNAQDRSRLARALYVDYDIYCGLRNREEFLYIQNEGLFDLSIWVDASERLPVEGEDSCTVTKDMCDIVIENNGTLEQLMKKTMHFKACMLGVT
jgi:hypothetical protein